MKKRSSIALLTALLAIVFAAGIGVYSNYIGMQIYEESSNHLLESYAQISKTFTLFVQRNWVVLSQWDSLMKNVQEDADIDSIWSDAQNNKLLWHYSDFYLFNESTQYLTVDGRKGSADSINGVFQEMYSKGEPIVSTYTATYGVPKIAFAMPMSRSLTLDGVTYTGIAVSYDTDVVDDLVDGSMYGGQSDCYVVRSNGDIVLELEPQTELCEGMTNLYDLSDHVDWKYGSMDDIRDCIQLGKSGSAQFTCDGVRNYLVAIPTVFSDWSLVGVIQTDEVDGAMLSVQQSTIIALGALCIFAVIIVVLALGMEDQLRLRREEEERLNLEREKMKSDRFLQSMSRIVDRYMVVNLDTGRYRYHELRFDQPLYPTSGQYSEMVEIISKRYVALTETENAKLSRLLEPDYLRSVLRKPDDNLKIEYCSRTENAYMVLTVLPVEWHADGTVAVVMEVVQDIGQKVELENMANTDSLTGLFNERYFSRVLNICETKKLPFVLYYLDLDRFKPVNDTYGHAMGDRLLKEISARLLRCIRSRDYAFRIGGDEFALIVSADMDEEQRSRMTERIQTMLSAPIVIEEKVLSVGVSCGCACYPEDGDASAHHGGQPYVRGKAAPSRRRPDGGTVMKHKTLRCTAETAALLLTVAMLAFLIAGLHQHDPDRVLSTLNTGWYQLTDGVRREITLPVTLPAEPGQTLTLYNDTLTARDAGKMLSARGVEYGIEIRAGETLLYRYEDNAFPKNTQMKGRLWADAELPDNIGGQTLSLTFTQLSDRTGRFDAPLLGSVRSITGHHIQTSLFSLVMMLAMVILAVLALLIFCYMSSCGIRERRFLDVAVFLLLCSLWCLTDSALYQIYGRDTAAGSVVSFYAFMLMSIPMVHFVRNTISGRRRLVPDICIALFCANALAQGAAYRLFGIRFIDMLPLTHLLLAAGVAAMLTVLLRSYREQPSQQLRLRIAAFAALGVFGVAALVLYGLLHIYWYDAIFQLGVLLFIILLFRELLGQATEDMRFHMEHRISHQMQREDRMTGLPNRRAFEEYMERIRTGEVGCRDAVLTYIRLEGLNERNDRLGLQAGDEAVIAAARCVADFCRACEDGGESVSCFRTGGNEFALIRPEPRANSGQLHRQFSAIVARYNRTCAPRARITMTYGFSRLCDEDGKSRSISAWKAEADAYLKRNETRLGGDTE